MSHNKVSFAGNAIALFLLIASLSGCANEDKNAQKPDSSNDANNPALTWILKDDYKPVWLFRDLPADVRAVINAPMAEPNEPFNSSDVMVLGLPLRRFILGGFSDDYAFIFYERGGFVYTRPFVVVKRDSRKAKIIFFDFFTYKIESQEKLKSLIRRGDFTEIKDDRLKLL
jgi:hypothetical protein